MLRKWLPYVSVSPLFLIYTIVLIIPIAWAIYLSFNEVTISLRTTFVFLDNYVQLFGDPYFHNSLRASAVFVVGSVIGQFILGLLMALLLNEGLKGTSFFRTIFMVTMALSDAVVGYAWYMMYNESEHGIINSMLRSIGFPAFEWLTNLNMAVWSMTIANIWFGGSFAMIILETGLKSISSEVYEAAIIDGASKLQRFGNITIPLLKPFIATCLTIITLLTFNYFGLILVITGGGPIHSTEVVPLYMWNLAFEFGEFGYGATVGVFAIIVNVVAMGIYQFSLRR